MGAPSGEEPGGLQVGALSVHGLKWIGKEENGLASSEKGLLREYGGWCRQSGQISLGGDGNGSSSLAPGFQGAFWLPFQAWVLQSAAFVLHAWMCVASVKDAVSLAGNVAQMALTDKRSRLWTC